MKCVIYLMEYFYGLFILKMTMMQRMIHEMESHSMRLYISLERSASSLIVLDKNSNVY